MFTAFSTGISGLMKVAQEKIVVSTSGEPEAEANGAEKEKSADTPTTASDSKQSDAALSKEEEAAEETTTAAEGEQTPREGIEATGATTAEKDEAIIGVAKEWGSYLFGGVKDVTMKVTSSAANASEAFSSGAQMLKKTVEENTILGDFNRQQEQFLEDHKETDAAQDAALPPWMGYAEDEENLKEQILALSSDERHFLRPPPGGVSYQFDYGTSYPIALATLEADPTLRDMRFKLVPKKIKEEEFWRNYFYRVSLIKQSVALHSMSHEDEAASAAGGKGAVESEGAASGKEEGTTSATGEEEEDDDDIPEWEKELQRELQEYEVVGDADGNQEVTAEPEESEEWQEEIQKMLEQANVDDTPNAESTATS